MNIYQDLKNADFCPVANYVDPEILNNIYDIVRKSNEPLEGNILFEHHSNDFNIFIPRFHKKRRALALFAHSTNSILEIGFNSGFSALLMLSVNHNLTLHAVDICSHKYTLPCFSLLKQVFKDRINLSEGNSLIQLPIILNSKNFDSFHIDGGHGIDMAEADLVNVLAKAKTGSVICFDDTDDYYYELKIMLLRYVLSGQITDIGSSFGFIDNQHHMFFIKN
jgi:predicted O-methyltransferase YrrM